MNYVTITHRDSCKTFALKRVGLENIINYENDSPSIKELYESNKFEKIEIPEIGCILIWKYPKGEDGYWHPHEIDEKGRIIYIKRFDYGHVAVFEENDMVSDVSWEEGQGAIIRLRKYSELPKPNLILKIHNKYDNIK